MLWVYVAIAVILVPSAIWAYRREVAYRRRTGISRSERHDPGQDYHPPPPIVG